VPKNRNKNKKEPFMTNPGISSSRTGLEGFSLIMVLQISTSEIGARDKSLEDFERGGMSIWQWLL
jgi:hypothetical protein